MLTGFNRARATQVDYIYCVQIIALRNLFFPRFLVLVDLLHKEARLDLHKQDSFKIDNPLMASIYSGLCLTQYLT